MFLVLVASGIGALSAVVTPGIFFKLNNLVL